MIAPVASRDFLRDQRIRRFGIGHAQQRLGEAHEGEAFRVAIDVSLAKERLGFTAQIDLEDGLRNMVDALAPDRDR